MMDAVYRTVSEFQLFELLVSVSYQHNPQRLSGPPQIPELEVHKFQISPLQLPAPNCVWLITGPFNDAL
jgi:hypothetical protein